MVYNSYTTMPVSGTMRSTDEEPLEGARAWLGLGSNEGDRRARLREALAALEEEGAEIERTSPLYRTEAKDAPGPDYLNAVVRIRCPWSPRELLARCEAIERRCGRRTKGDRAPRPLDLDILLYEGLVLDTERLELPHPRLAERRFVLEPLAWIEPELEVPGEGRTTRALLERCEDPGRVERLEERWR